MVFVAIRRNPKMTAENNLDCVVESNKKAADIDQYATSKDERPEGVLMLMLENWLQDVYGPVAVLVNGILMHGSI